MSIVQMPGLQVVKWWDSSKGEELAELSSKKICTRGFFRKLLVRHNCLLFLEFQFLVHLVFWEFRFMFTFIKTSEIETVLDECYDAGGFYFLMSYEGIYFQTFDQKHYKDDWCVLQI